MPFLGAHVSTAGGLRPVFERIGAVGGEAMQIFTKNQRQWNAPAIAAEDAAFFRKEWENSGGMPVAAHCSYLINLAESDTVKAARAVSAFALELQRASILGIALLVTHIGSHMGQGVETGLGNFVLNLDRAIEEFATLPEAPLLASSEAAPVTVLLETTAGQGTGLGFAFEHLARIIETSRYGRNLGVCFDTCHVFAAGYDFRTGEGYDETFSHLDETIGLERIKFFHLNDSKKDLGSRIDRHEHIGKGHIGLNAFRLLVNDYRFSGLPMVLETPKENGLERDRENLAVLRSLLQSREGPGGESTER